MTKDVSDSVGFKLSFKIPTRNKNQYEVTNGCISIGSKPFNPTADIYDDTITLDEVINQVGNKRKRNLIILLKNTGRTNFKRTTMTYIPNKQIIIVDHFNNKDEIVQTIITEKIITNASSKLIEKIGSYVEDYGKYLINKI